MSRADQPTVDLLTEYFAVMEAKDYVRLGDFLADDVTLTFANAPTVTGKDVVLAQLADIGGTVDSSRTPWSTSGRRRTASSSSRSTACGASPTAW